MEAIVKFNLERVRADRQDGLAPRLLAELVNGPVVVRSTHTQALQKYKRRAKDQGLDIPAFRTQKVAGEDKKFIVALSAGPFERFIEQPDWIK